MPCDKPSNRPLIPDFFRGEQISVGVRLSVRNPDRTRTPLAPGDNLQLTFKSNRLLPDDKAALMARAVSISITPSSSSSSSSSGSSSSSSSCSQDLPLTVATFVIPSSETIEVASGTYYWDIKLFSSTYGGKIILSGQCVAKQPITEAIT